MRPRSLAGVSRSGPGSKGGAEPRRLALLPGRVRLFAAAAGATYLGAQRADPDPAPPRPLEAGLHGRDLLLPTGRVAGPAVLPQPARQLQRPHPDRRAQATAPLPTRRARHLDLGQPALPPQPGHGRLAGDPAPLAPGRVPARVCPRPGPGGGVVGQPEGCGAGQPLPRHDRRGAGRRPAGDRPGPPRVHAAVLISAALRARAVKYTSTYSAKLFRRSDTGRWPCPLTSAGTAGSRLPRHRSRFLPRYALSTWAWCVAGMGEPVSWSRIGWLG